ncbi:hypothetical protein F5Y18DRAFT_413524 [Xylariaceae sp. FL1019]|nr:hypothetical protein F5Y18DRAFT_413524 [Xylariaceae sp. FL1019]
MATSREERMQQRMRGAGRHEVADDSFGFVLPAAEPSSDQHSEPPTEPPSSSIAPARAEPNSSAKRRRLNNEPGPSPTPRPTTRRTSPRFSGGNAVAAEPNAHDNNSSSIRRRTESQSTKKLSTTSAAQATPYDALDESSREEITQDSPAVNGTTARTEEPKEPEEPEEADNEDTVMVDIPASTPRSASRGSAVSRVSRDISNEFAEEVTESPVAAPGSGKRRHIISNNAGTQSARLQRIVMEAEAGTTGEITTSSPLVRKARLSETTVAPISTRVTRAAARKSLSSPIEGPRGSSPLARQSRASAASPTPVRSGRRAIGRPKRRSPLSTVVDEGDKLSSPPDAAGTGSPKKPLRTSRQSRHRSVPESPGPAEAGEEEQQAEVEPEKDLAEEDDDLEAARQLGRKRRRVSAESTSANKLLPDAKETRPATKKSRRRTHDSPAIRSHPKPLKERRRRSPKRQGDGDSIPVTVQRYTRPLRRNEADSDEDILTADIPYTDHKSPNVVDIVLQMCEESFDKYLSALHEEANLAQDKKSRKEFRTKLRALEAFQEEVRIRLQTHTIVLDNLRTLRKRVRAAQKEKVMLRQEISRIRAEREQVALKMDAIRNRHEAAAKESIHQLNLSTSMDDIEIAIENGKAALDLQPKQQKVAELGNLDLLIAQIADKVSMVGDRGGALKQIRDFNAFLERAALALEAGAR